MQAESKHVWQVDDEEQREQQDNEGEGDDGASSLEEPAEAYDDEPYLEKATRAYEEAAKILDEADDCKWQMRSLKAQILAYENAAEALHADGALWEQLAKEEFETLQEAAKDKDQKALMEAVDAAKENEEQALRKAAMKRKKVEADEWEDWTQKKWRTKDSEDTREWQWQQSDWSDQDWSAWGRWSDEGRRS